MKKLLSIASIVAAAVLCFGVIEAQAVGLGVYGASGSGTSTWEVTDNSSSGASIPEFDRDVDQSSFGLVFDTNVAEDRLFNYRLNLGAETHTFTDPNISSSKSEGKGFFWGNTFGFGIVRTSVVRLWLGPQLSFSYLQDKEDSTVDVTMVGVGVAPVLGININLGPVVTLALDGGYRYMQYGGTAKGKGTNTTDSAFTVEDRTTFVNAAFIFRFGDRY